VSDWAVSTILAGLLLAAQAVGAVRTRRRRARSRYDTLVGLGVAPEAAATIAGYREASWRWCSTCDAWQPPEHFELSAEVSVAVATRKGPPPK
jgi:hypothetical protein